MRIRTVACGVVSNRMDESREFYAGLLGNAHSMGNPRNPRDHGRSARKGSQNKP